jgi:hypothetical protein
VFVFDTEKSRIAVGGAVDFRNARIDIALRPEAEKPGPPPIRGPI